MTSRLISSALFKLRPIICNSFNNNLLTVQSNIGPNCVQMRTKRRTRRYLVWPNDWLPFNFEQDHEELGYFRTGDVEEPATVFEAEYQKGFEWLETTDSVPEDVKKQFRLSFAKPKENGDYKEQLYVNAIASHPYDQDSFEARIAKYTYKIQSMRFHVRYVNPDNVKYKRLINHCWGKRTRLLNHIARVDNEKYELIKNVLRIEHTAGEPGVIPEKIQRKRELRRLTEKYCNDIKEERLDQFRAKLQAQQQHFLQERDNSKKWIEDQMAQHKISEEEINDYKKSRRRF